MENRARACGRWWLPVMAVLAGLSATLGFISQATAEQAHRAAIGAPARAGRSAQDGSSLTATALRVDTLSNPIGLGDRSPSLSWFLSSDGGGHSAAARQTAYEIRVASTISQLTHPDLWDSGKVVSSDTNNLAYRGTPLRSREDAVWDVRVWDASGHAGAWSAPARWEMGLLSQSDWSARWIEDPAYSYATNGVPNPLPIFAKPFDAARGIVSARLYITGLGQYSASLNGSPVSNAVLDPGQTSYWAEVDYRTFDVTRLLRSGSNVVGIETGSGVYQQADSTPMGRYMFQPGNNVVFGAPKVL